MSYIDRRGKMTSPSRSIKDMSLLTEEFIAKISPLFESNLINKNNLFVFDETVIGQSDLKKIFVSERRSSGGGNTNVIWKRTKALGSFTPFSLVDGTSPFRVFITREGKKRKSASSRSSLEPTEKVVRIASQYRLYLSS